MDKQQILDEIRRTAAQNGGVAPGRARFLRETGIREGDWRGRFWAHWSEALHEAGVAPPPAPAAAEPPAVLERVALLARQLGQFPTQAQLRSARAAQPDFPSSGAIERLGGKAELFDQLRAFCRADPAYEDVRSMLEAALLPSLTETPRRPEALVEDGYVFLLQSGKHHRIVHTLSMARGEVEQAIAQADNAKPVHNIRSDDPAGIAAYWEQRFAARKTSGPWLVLSMDDVAAFKRRKFM